VSKPRIARSRARLAAAQALYQLDLGGEDAGDVVSEFQSHRLGFEQDALQGETLGDSDEKLFADIVNGVVGRQVEIDKALAGSLVAGWALDRIDATLRAVMRAAAYEIIARPDVPAKVVLDEYVRVADAFFAGDEVKFANGVLNTLARKVRPTEFGIPAQ
jgi:N utilization substance protein B